MKKIYIDKRASVSGRKSNINTDNALDLNQHIDKILDSKNIDTWEYKELTITAGEITSMGASPIEILPAPGLNKYYKYEGVAEYNYDTGILLGANDSIGITHYYDGGTGDYTGTWFIGTSWASSCAYQFSSVSPYFVNNLFTPTNLLTQGRTIVNEPVYMTTWTGNDPTGDGSFKIKIKYKIETFG